MKLHAKMPATADGVAAILTERLVRDVGLHAVCVETQGDATHSWTTDGEILMRAVWACVHGCFDLPILLPGGDAAPASTLVETYGLQPLWRRRIAAPFN